MYARLFRWSPVEAVLPGDLLHADAELVEVDQVQIDRENVVLYCWPTTRPRASRREAFTYNRGLTVPIALRLDQALEALAPLRSLPLAHVEDGELVVPLDGAVLTLSLPESDDDEGDPEVVTFTGTFTA